VRVVLIFVEKEKQKNRGVKILVVYLLQSMLIKNKAKNNIE